MARKTDSQRSVHTQRTLEWRREKIDEGFKRLETYFSAADHKKLKKAAKEQEIPVAGLVREIVKGWLKGR